MSCLIHSFCNEAFQVGKAVLLYFVVLTSLSCCTLPMPDDDALYQDDWSSWCAMSESEANRGLALGMNNLATCYEEGLGDYPKDSEKALYWYRMAASRGNNAAKMNLARLPQELIRESDKQPARVSSSPAPESGKKYHEVESARASMKRD